MGKGCYGNRYLQTKRGAAAVATIVIAFVLLVLLNVEGYFYGPYQMIHYLSFSYLLNGCFFILHALIGDLEPTKRYLVTYYGSGALMYLVNGFISLSYQNSKVSTVVILILTILQGGLMAAMCFL
ncbi:hypothetical protein MTO96_004718 [Rhipicephalus appendiculatus]